MYIAGRLRTASRPLRTWMPSAVYSLVIRLLTLPFPFGGALGARPAIDRQHDLLDERGAQALVQPLDDVLAQEPELLHPDVRGDVDEEDSIANPGGARLRRDVGADRLGPGFHGALLGESPVEPQPPQDLRQKRSDRLQLAAFAPRCLPLPHWTTPRGAECPL